MSVNSNRFILGIAGWVMLFSCTSKTADQNEVKRPNIVFILADEWRGQDTGFNGNSDVLTPNLDKLAAESINLVNAVSGTPVCTPYRASLLTGQYPLSTGVFMNDVMLDPETTTLPKVLNSLGYQTAYIGKWHLDGHGRDTFIPKERRQGFDYWKVLECTHNYNHSKYWDNEDREQVWEGYDAFAQTEDAIAYVNNQKESQPFLLMLSWGSPHTPYDQAPEEYKDLYRNKAKDLTVRSNVPVDKVEDTQNDFIGYYGHITALDKCIGDLQKAIATAGLEENTIFIFTSDHGNMINSHRSYFKQQPYEESIIVPFLLKYPDQLGREGRTSDMMLNTPDIMPTILGLSKVKIPDKVEGNNLSDIILGNQTDTTESVLISCPQPFGQWSRAKGGKEYRGIRTKGYTYVSDLNGSWLLFDNKNDPYQLENLISNDSYKQVKGELHAKMQGLLDKTHDAFLPGMDYINKWGYVVDKTGTIPYHGINFRGDSIR